MNRRQLIALAAHDVDGLVDREIADRCGVGRRAIGMRRARGIASLPPAVRRRYLDRFPPRLGRPGKKPVIRKTTSDD
jgi:hypothetical protein